MFTPNLYNQTQIEHMLRLINEANPGRYREFTSTNIQLINIRQNTSPKDRDKYNTRLLVRRTDAPITNNEYEGSVEIKYNRIVLQDLIKGSPLVVESFGKVRDVEITTEEVYRAVNERMGLQLLGTDLVPQSWTGGPSEVVKTFSLAGNCLCYVGTGDFIWRKYKIPLPTLYRPLGPDTKMPNPSWFGVSPTGAPDGQHIYWGVDFTPVRDQISDLLGALVPGSFFIFNPATGGPALREVLAHALSSNPNFAVSADPSTPVNRGLGGVKFTLTVPGDASWPLGANREWPYLLVGKPVVGGSFFTDRLWWYFR